MEKREIIKRYLYHFLLFFLFGITVIISGTEHSYADAQVIRVGFYTGWADDPADRRCLYRIWCGIS